MKTCVKESANETHSKKRSFTTLCIAYAADRNAGFCNGPTEEGARASAACKRTVARVGPESLGIATPAFIAARPFQSGWSQQQFTARSFQHG
jgi:3D (Asp-Asp-Asp) domain-containing protein